MDDDEIVRAVREAFDGDALCERMERWAEAHAHSIDLELHPATAAAGQEGDEGGSMALEGVEMPARYMALHVEWCDMLEEELEGAAVAAGGSVAQLFGALREGQRRLQAPRGGSGGGAGMRSALAASERASSLLELAVQTADFGFWLGLMVETARDASTRASSGEDDDNEHEHKDDVHGGARHK